MNDLECVTSHWFDVAEHFVWYLVNDTGRCGMFLLGRNAPRMLLPSVCFHMQLLSVSW